MRVLMLNEGTYPYYKGGVSTWTHSLISGLRDFEYLVLTLTTKPPLKPLYPKPPNVQSFISIPLWGTEYVGEHLPDFTVRWLMKLSRMTSDREVREKFVPAFREFIREVKRGGRNPEAIGEALAEMHRFLVNHSFKKTFRSGHVWKVFLEELEADELYSNMRIAYVLKIGSIMRNLFKTLAYRCPDANLIHSSAAGICGLIGVVKKIEDETPYVITEHGIYYRERLLDVSHRELNLPEKVFWLNFYKVITLVNYYYADRILPVCEFNVRWESRFGIPRSKIEVIYNGVDVERFRPMKVEVGGNRNGMAFESRYSLSGKGGRVEVLGWRHGLSFDPDLGRIYQGERGIKIGISRRGRIKKVSMSGAGRLTVVRDKQTGGSRSYLRVYLSLRPFSNLSGGFSIYRYLRGNPSPDYASRSFRTWTSSEITRRMRLRVKLVIFRRLYASGPKSDGYVQPELIHRLPAHVEAGAGVKIERGGDWSWHAAIRSKGRLNGYLRLGGSTGLETVYLRVRGEI